MKKGKGREKTKEKMKGQKQVLVGVLKDRRDLRILLEEKWYRIPVAFLPKRKFTHVAFYQPAALGRKGKRIEYYARVAGKEIRKRVELLPKDSEHPRAGEDYLKVSFNSVEELAKPIRNVVPRRVSFGFTDLKTLRSARDILELYSVPPTEQILERALNRRGIKTLPQYTLSAGGKRYRLDLAIFCEHGNIAIECDNRKAHSSQVQKLKDKQKDADLKKLGWRVIRFSEPDILERLNASAAIVQKVFQQLGGQGK
ncbi:MAG: DUF559 domain-containing protein [Candidatus Liptonbacteria bacterium]|nr:DUF559 domain-containing protein [Candidatus Liptonbacteria bacterium]